MTDVQNRIDHEMTLMMGRIDGKLDAALSRMDRIETETEHIETQISSLERWRAYLIGAASLAGAISAQLVDHIIDGFNAT